MRVTVKGQKSRKGAPLRADFGLVNAGNALAETIIDLFKTEVINRLGLWMFKDQVEWETLKWVDRFNKERLLEPLGYITSIEAEEKYERALESDKIAA